MAWKISHQNERAKKEKEGKTGIRSWSYIRTSSEPPARASPSRLSPSTAGPKTKNRVMWTRNKLLSSVKQKKKRTQAPEIEQTDMPFSSKVPNINVLV